MAQRWQNIFFNICIALNCLLIFLLLFGANLRLPSFLQVAGRMHPLLLHFPIVLLIVFFIWELFVPKKDHLILKNTADWLLLAAAFTSVLTALMGIFLSKEEGYDADAIALHKWSGVSIALITMLLFTYRELVRKKKLALFLTGSLSMIAIIFTGHQGAGITHGENFLLAPISPEKKKRDVLFEDAMVYTHLVRPILEEKCMGCHNSRKAKGELIMETENLLLKGGKNGKLWDSTAAGFGLLMQRIHLPEDEKKHMPPAGKPQLRDEEMKALFYWIKSGAGFTQKITDLPETDSLRLIASGFFKTTEIDQYDFTAAGESEVKKLNTDYRLVNPIALNSPALNVEFFGASFFKSKQLNELEKVKNNIVTLSVSKMPLTDEDLKQIASFKNLRRLNLSFTGITGASLYGLKKLTQLRQLSISGNKVNAADLESLKGLEKLVAVYIWNTGITEKELVKLKQIFPETFIETGFRGDTVIAKLNTPVIESEEQIFTTSAHTTIKSFIKGAVLRYSINGIDPDSLTSPVYKDDILINKSGVLKVKAFLPGWKSSDVAAKNFYRSGFKADSVVLVTQPDPSYKASGGKSLSDGEKGDLNFRTRWLGYKEKDLQAYLYFNTPVELTSVSISTIIDIGSYIMPAQQIQVWGGTSLSNLKILKQLTPQQPSMLAPAYLTGFDCEFAIKQISILKIVAKPVTKLPLWHPGKGQKGWFFIDEIFLN